MARRADIIARLRQGPATNAELQEACSTHNGDISRTLAQMIEDGEADNIAPVRGRGHPALYALPPRCVNAHDRCFGGAGGPCPYCERPGVL